MAKDKKEANIGHEIEFVSHGDTSEITGSAWWDYDKKKIEASSVTTLSFLKMTQMVVEKDEEEVLLSFEDGEDFLDALPDYFRSHLSARKKR
jgi:hypothetical protein